MGCSYLGKLPGDFEGNKKVKEYIWAFMYCPCIYESAHATVSLHKTEKGAQMAMEFHKAAELKEWEDLYKDNNPFNSVFGESERWSVEQIEIQD